MPTDALVAVLDDVGREAAGPVWLAFRPTVMAWVDGNPAKVEAVKARIRAAVREGRL